ncbi:MAG TPA: GspH/FimT family pseudopilin [Tepidisphaeraceae bacterium]
MHSKLTAYLAEPGCPRPEIPGRGRLGFRGARVNQNSQRSGFTVVEMVMCMVIMVIFTAIAAPRYAESIAHYRVDMAARRLSGDLNWARTLARSTSTSVSVSFNTTSSAYTLNGVADPDMPTQTYSVNLLNNPYKSTLSSASFNSATTLTFDGYGSPSSAGSVVLTCGSFTKTISVSADDGAVSVQ